MGSSPTRKAAVQLRSSARLKIMAPALRRAIARLEGSAAVQAHQPAKLNVPVRKVHITVDGMPLPLLAGQR